MHRARLRLVRDEETEEAADAGCRGGFVADGPGFRVWEESHGEALDRAGGLAASLTLSQARRLSRSGGEER